MLLVGSSRAGATDLRVETGPVERISGANRIRVSARLTWKNSWRTPRNHDAVWTFAKIRVRPGARWRHATVAAIAPGARLGCRATVDRIGAFCSPATEYRGDLSESITLELDLSALSEQERASTAIEATVFGIEMVYVPAGPFSVGDLDPKSAQQAAFFRSDASGHHAGLYRITSESAIQVAPSEGAFYYESRTQYEGDRRGPIPAEFPKGTRAFYVMKYEVAQGQYAAFLNSIGTEATFFRANTAGIGYAEHRGTITIVGGRYVAGWPDRPANMLSWDDGTAFADWAGLRPMTELEFTKAARGPVEPVAGDYPWGTNSKARLLRRTGEDGELMRTGAADESQLADSTRDILGASYWWVMDLAGSVWEKVVTVGHPAGRAFKGTHGDGELRDYGLATNDDWPSGDHNAGGYGYRGGGFYEWERERAKDPLAQSLNPHSPVSWRPYGSWGGAPRSIAYGFRAARTADVPGG